jgi:hypothetical protein
LLAKKLDGPEKRRRKKGTVLNRKCPFPAHPALRDMLIPGKNPIL